MHIQSIIIAFLFLGACFHACSTGEPQEGDQKEFRQTVLQSNPALQYFVSIHPDSSVIKYAIADLNNDGRNEVVVIYRLNKNKNMMSIIQDFQTGYTETNAVPAPVSDQMIQFRNIDDKPPLEFILQGRKGAKIGYAIFRIENGRLMDLFGEGMQDCC